MGKGIAVSSGKSCSRAVRGNILGLLQLPQPVLAVERATRGQHVPGRGAKQARFEFRQPRGVHVDPSERAVVDPREARAETGIHRYRKALGVSYEEAPHQRVHDDGARRHHAQCPRIERLRAEAQLVEQVCGVGVAKGQVRKPPRRLGPSHERDNFFLMNRDAVVHSAPTVSRYRPPDMPTPPSPVA